MSGPYFQTVAARSRRRAGLLSKIVRPCESILIVDHKPPCNVTRENLNEQRRLQGSHVTKPIVAPEKFRPPAPTETCVYITTGLGLRGYEGTKENTFLIPKGLLSGLEREKISRYGTCYAYEFNNVMGGFWKSQKEIFGSAYNAAFTFGVIGNILGFICTVLVWCAACCVATKARFWTIMAYIFALIGLFMIWTLIFFASDVCENGCTFGPSAGYAVASGLIWWLAAGASFSADPVDKRIPKASCCCCPTIETRVSGKIMYSSVPVKEDAQVLVVEEEKA